MLGRMNESYVEFGYNHNVLDSFTLKGKDGLEQISPMMSSLEAGISPFENIAQIIDYSNPVDADWDLENCQRLMC